MRAKSTVGCNHGQFLINTVCEKFYIGRFDPCTFNSGEQKAFEGVEKERNAEEKKIKVYKMTLSLSCLV